MGFKLIKILLGIETVLIFIQFYLGMNINLFVKIPLTTPQNFANYSGGAEVAAHIIDGILILTLASIILSYGSRLRNVWVSALSAFALGFALVAVATGATFTLRGQDGSLSLTMAMSFIMVFTIYVSEFHLVRKMQEIDMANFR